MKLIELKKNKGQAAMTDSLFFLTIIVALSVLLFKFSATYGERIDLSINNLYFKEYTNSTLKTIFYTDIPLDFGKNIYSENTFETDYLITALKTDFLPDKKIGASEDISELSDASLPNDRDIAKYNLFHTIKSIMYPLSNYDYIFYLENRNDDEFIYFMLKINELNDNQIESKYFLCNPLSISPVRTLVQNANKIYSSSTPMIFRYTVRGTTDNINAVANLTIWPSSIKINSEYILDEENNLRCKEYTED